MRIFFQHFRNYVIRGFLAVIPVGISVLTIRFLYVVIDQRIMGIVNQWIGYRIPGLGILILLLALYFLGLIASNVLGKQAFNLLDRIFHRIPLVKIIYQGGKQLAAALSLPERQVFKRAVLVNFPKPGIWSIGFVTGTVIDHANGDETILKLLIPTAPNPMSGFVMYVRESEVRETGWAVEEALRAVISIGIIGPEIVAPPNVSNDEKTAGA